MFVKETAIKEELFSKIKPDEKFKCLLNDVYHSDTFKNTNFKEFVDGMDSATKRTITAGDALSQYKTHLQSADKESVLELYIQMY